MQDCILMSTIQLSGINKVYPDGHLAVSEFDLTIREGEFFVLVGASGCGKSTVLRIIAGLEAATGGEVKIDGHVVVDDDPRGRDVAMTFQGFALYPMMTVAENIGFPLVVAKVDRASIERRVAEIAALLQLTDVLHDRPGRLSGGQRQRAALGRAIVREPRLLLMDEPMSNLDAKLRAETRVVITRIQRRLALTTLYVTHDQVEAMTMGDRVAVMDQGRIRQCGPPMELYDDPVDAFVAQSLGSPRMNLVVATVINATDEPAVQIGHQVLQFDRAVLARFPGLSQVVGGRVALGIRPEFVGMDPGGSLVVGVSHVENLGDRLAVHARIDAAAVTPTADGVVVGDVRSSTFIVAAGSGTEVDAWQPLRLTVDTSKINFFDLATGDSMACHAVVGAVT